MGNVHQKQTRGRGKGLASVQSETCKAARRFVESRAQAAVFKRRLRYAQRAGLLRRGLALVQHHGGVAHRGHAGVYERVVFIMDVVRSARIF